MTTQQTAPSSDNHLLYSLKEGRQPGDTHIVPVYTHSKHSIYLIYALSPGELVIEAWKQLKLMREYEQRKKLEMMGAMVFNSAIGK